MQDVDRVLVDVLEDDEVVGVVLVLLVVTFVELVVDVLLVVGLVVSVGLVVEEVAMLVVI